MVGCSITDYAKKKAWEPFDVHTMTGSQRHTRPQERLELAGTVDHKVFYAYHCSSSNMKWLMLTLPCQSQNDLLYASFPQNFAIDTGLSEVDTWT